MSRDRGIDRRELLRRGATLAAVAGAAPWWRIAAASASVDPRVKALSNELQGTVVEVLAGGNYKIKVSENHEVLARLNGKMRQYRIRVIQGDRVTVGVSPYDLKRGLITYRAK